MNQFNRQNLPEIRKDMQDALDAIGKKHGIDFNIGRVSFTNSNFTAKVEAAIISKDGIVKTPEMQNLLAFGKGHLGNDFDVDKVYNMDGKKIKVVGFSPRRSKYPFSFIDVNTGKQFKTSVSHMKSVVNR